MGRRVDGEDEAQFVADRANAVLAADGRLLEQGYRGARYRIAVDEPRTRVHPRSDIGAEAAYEGAPQEEARAAGRRAERS